MRDGNKLSIESGKSISMYIRMYMQTAEECFTTLEVVREA